MGAIKRCTALARSSAKGQTMAEYALIFLAVVVIVYVSYQTIGTTISSNVKSVDNLF